MSSTSLLPESVPLLSFLPADARKIVEASFVPVTYAFGATIVKQGDDADAFFVLVSGRANIVKEGQRNEAIALGSLRAGESFGENALIEQGKRAVTVRAASDVSALRLDKIVFRAILKSHPDIAQYFELQARHRGLSNFFRLDTPFSRLSPDALAMMLGELEPVTFGPGEPVVREGDAAGPMFVVEEGRLRTFIEQDGRRRYIAYLRKGDYFGEMALFNGARRSATIETVSACRLLRLTPESFQRLLDKFPDFRERIKERVLQYKIRESVRVPLDFAEELLPAAADVVESVGPTQVDAPQPVVPTGPFATPDGHFVKKARRIRKIHYVRQVDEMDCGAACLAMICRHFGRKVSLARIRQILHTSTEGTSLKALRNGALDLGLAARAVKCPKDKVHLMPLPAIIHWEGNHWIVLHDVNDKHIWVADPGLGPRRIDRAEFVKKWSGYTALFDYTPAFENAPEGRASFAWMLQFLKPHVGLLGQAMALAAIIGLLEMVFPVFTQVVVDKVLVDRNLELLHIVLLAMFAAVCLSVLATVVQRYLLSFVAVRFDAGSLDFVTRRLLALPLPYFVARKTGDIQRRLSGMRNIRQFLIQNGVRVLTATFQFTAALTLMLFYSTKLTLIFLTTFPLYALFMRFSHRYLRPMFFELEEGFGKYSSQQIDAIKGIETVKALGVEAALRDVLLNQFNTMAQRQFRSDFLMMCYEGATRAVTFLTTIGFLWAGADAVMSGALTVGGFVAFSSLVAMANGPITTALAVWDELQSVQVLLDRLNDVFEPEPEQGKDHSRLVPVRTLEGSVRFDNVSLRFGGPSSAKILDGVTFEVPAGKRVAIVGRSGSGKTTLVKCLAGLLEPTEGTISYDGLELTTLNYRQLRRFIGWVLQDNYLFNDTIAKNISLGDEEPDMDQVLWAARAADAQGFIERLPLGYETRIGESGLALSGGQRQRVAIARAVYRRPPVLIFDEATSALDTESEQNVKRNLDQILEGRTSFVIAHRLSTVRDADVILVLEKGAIIEQGTHEDLMKQQGLYHHLCSQQLQL